jgi:RHS repeat-associated protein
VVLGLGDSDSYSYDSTGRMTQYQFNVGSGASTPTFVQSTYGGQNANATSFSKAFTSNVTAGDLLFVTFANGSTNSISSISDTLGNTYTALPLNTASGYRLQAFYTLSRASGADTVTGTYSGSGATYIQETLAEYSNVGALDAHAENGNGTNSQPSTTTTTTAGSDLVIGYVTDSYTSWTGETGWNLRTTGSGIRAALQDTIAANPGSITSTFNTVNGWSAGIVAFKPKSGGPLSNTGVLKWNADGTLSQLAITDGFNSGGTHTCNYGNPASSVPGYDDLGRLIKVDCGASLWQQNFSYDAFGNVSKTVPAGGTGISWLPGYNAANNRYTLSGTAYDASGRLLNDTFHTYAWDAEGHLAAVDSSSCGTNGTCLTYDALERPVEKSVAGVYTQFLYSPVGKLGIMNGQTLVSADIALPGGAVYHITPGYAGFRHRDWLGSSRVLSTISNRTIHYDRAFAPFGESYLNFGATDDYDFTGDTQDTVTGTYDTPNRELNPSQGRWLSPDPAEFSASNMNNPQSLNLYAYVGNNPVSRTDPSGLCDGSSCSADGSQGGSSGGGGFGRGQSSCAGARTPESGALAAP